MANQIENIYAKQAEEQLKNILKNLEKIHREQMALNQLALNVNSGTASNPQDLQRVLNMYMS